MTKSDQSHTPRRRRIGFANVVAIVALFVALGGGAYAASSIGTSDIKNKAVTTQKLDGKAVTAGKLGRDAVKKNKLRDGAVTDSKLSTDSKSRWAVVRANGTLDRGKGVLSSARVGLGNYEVIFDRDVTQCSWVVSIGAGDTIGTARGFTQAALRVNNSSGVFIGTYNKNDASEARPFHMQLSC